jgi:hypothetical protein
VWLANGGALRNRATARIAYVLLPDVEQGQASRALLEAWTATEDIEATEDAWALTNACEAIREEPW